MRTGPHAFEPYLAAHQRAYAWAEKALRYRCSDKFVHAKAAVERVEYWCARLGSLKRGSGRAFDRMNDNQILDEARLRNLSPLDGMKAANLSSLARKVRISELPA
jgi:hypothetical protein